MTGPEPSSIHTARYRPDPGTTDGRLYSDVFERVGPAVIAALSPWLGRGPGRVLEIGAGTGQHAAACAAAFPALEWWPSDPDPIHRASARAWAAALRVSVREPLDLDAAGPWAELPAVQALGPLSAVVAMNVVHIAPFAVATGIVAGAAATLAPGGLMILCGPFNVHGQTVGPTNATFDARLRAENPDWGLRDTAEIEALGTAAGLDFAALQAMPANNRLLVLRKT